MLIPIVHNSNRLWIDLSFGYEREIYTSTAEVLSRHLLKDARVNAILSDADIIPQINQSVGNLMQEGTKNKEIVARISAAYGIPLRFAEEIIKGEILVKN